MKFHKDRTAIRSPVEGVEAYEKGFETGELMRIKITPKASRTSPHPRAWKIYPLHDLLARDDDATEPLEVTDITIPPRALVVDELTRHRTTRQIFIPIVGAFMVVAAESRGEDPDSPDPKSLVMVPVYPGEAFEVGVGTWHTLPYVFCGTAIGLSIMHRNTLNSYHDVRDLAAEGWIAILGLEDPIGGF